MNTDKAAKKKTMSDVSGKPNVAGLYSSIQSDVKIWDEIIKIVGRWKLNILSLLRIIEASMHIELLKIRSKIIVWRRLCVYVLSNVLWKNL